MIALPIAYWGSGIALTSGTTSGIRSLQKWSRKGSQLALALMSTISRSYSPGIGSVAGKLAGQLTNFSVWFARLDPLSPALCLVAFEYSL